MDLEKRVAGLERAATRWRAAAIVLAGLVVLGAAADESQPGGAGELADVVTATEFRLVDRPGGKIRGLWRVDEKGPRLIVGGEVDAAAVQLSVEGSKGVAMVMGDKGGAGNVSGQLSSDGKGAALLLNGSGGLGLVESRGAMFKVGGKGAAYAADGKPRILSAKK